ncbi:MAG: helix-turn-helix domain-containing protein [Alcaligenaceae bacterium]|nr:MAG: helix-turn-helix domain-containing protein [Alcaligenaceae bacterium]
MSEVMEGAMTAGTLLREARQASGMHIAALAVALKVPVSKLEALETDNYAALPDTVFVRALASSVCRALKVDPAPVLSLLPQSHSPRLSADSVGLNAPVKVSAGKSSGSAASFSTGSTSRSVTVVVLALLVGALVVFFFPREQGGSFIPSARMASTSIDPAQPVAMAPPTPAPATEISRASSSASIAGKDASVLPAAMQPVAPVTDVGAPQAASPIGAASEANNMAAPASGTLVLRARSQSWVQVKDASGVVVLQRNLASDESVSVNAPAPLAVVVGRADATEVFVRGKPFDLAGVTRENVARFEVK